MVAKIDFDTLKMCQQMRLKIAKNQKQPPLTQNLFVFIKKRVYYHKKRAPGESVLSHARVVNVGLLSLCVVDLATIMRLQAMLCINTIVRIPSQI